MEPFIHGSTDPSIDGGSGGSTKTVANSESCCEYQQFNPNEPKNYDNQQFHGNNRTMVESMVEDVVINQCVNSVVSMVILPWFVITDSTNSSLVPLLKIKDVKVEIPPLIQARLHVYQP